MQSRTNRYLCC